MEEIWGMVVCAVVLVFATGFTIRPIYFPLPFTSGKRVLVDFSVAPPIGVLILLCTTTLSPTDFSNGIRGTEQILPWAVMVIFFSLAYICISWDYTGVFEFIAIKILAFAGTSGRRVFLYYVLLSSLLTIVTSNDIVILTLTPITCYFCRRSGADSRPFLLSQFFAANIWSISLLIGNPTNIIVGQANSLSFLEYSAWMLAPAVVGGVSSLINNWFLFKRSIPIVLSHDAHAAASVPDATVVPALLTAVAVVKTPKDPPMGTTAAETAAAAATTTTTATTATTTAEATETDGLTSSGSKPATGGGGDGSGDSSGGDGTGGSGNTNSSNGLRDRRGAVLGAVWMGSCLVLLSAQGFVQAVEMWHVCLAFGGGLLLIDLARDVLAYRRRPRELRVATERSNLLGNISASSEIEPQKRQQYEEEQPMKSFDRLRAIASRLPWKVAPFAMSMFIIVEAMWVTGWVELLASGLSSVCTGPAAAVFAVGGASLIAANVLNNQPMTILFARILQHPSFVVPNEATRVGAMLALIVASNFGANFTLIGALAGLMWRNILDDKGYSISFLEFARWGFMANFGPWLLTSAAIVAELAIVFPEAF